MIKLYKKLDIIFCVIMMITASSCGVFSDTAVDSAKNENCMILKKAMYEKDIPKISNLYCQTVKNQHDLDHELEELFVYINGDIIEMGEMKKATDDEQWDNGECIKADCSYNIDFSTATDNYRMEVSENLIIADDQNKEGITFISIHHMDADFHYISNDKFVVGNTEL